MESTQPTLSLSPTEDLHIMCNMADFDPENPPHRVEAMQILASSDEEETKPQSVLATLDYSRGPSASSFLKNSGLLFKVTGNPGKELEWWLQVAFVGRIDVEVHDIANFPQSENPRMLDERDDSPGAVEMDSGPQAPAAQPLAKAELPDEDDDVSNAEVCDDVVNALNPSIATN
nr:hypothetical protein BaRGS_002133 [Batillaria attramentaria]